MRQRRTLQRDRQAIKYLESSKLGVGDILLFFSHIGDGFLICLQTLHPQVFIFSRDSTRREHRHRHAENRTGPLVDAPRQETSPVHRNTDRLFYDVHIVFRVFRGLIDAISRSD